MKNNKSDIQITKGFKAVLPTGVNKYGNNKINFKVGETYEEKGNLQMCKNGFHFCIKAGHVFDHYTFETNTIVYEIEAYGEVIHDTEGKSCCLKIKIIRQLDWAEVLVMANDGLNNTGRLNSGDSNSGDRNSGDRNSGDRNSGDRNSGDSNSGSWNSGDRNSGDSNSGYRNSGAFCTEKNPKLILFDKECDMTVREWEQHECLRIMTSVDPNIWVPSSLMSAAEKKANPKHETTEGYLKQITLHEAWANAWPNLSDAKKQLFFDLPNFDAKKFEEITGITVKQPKKK